LRNPSFSGSTLQEPLVYGRIMRPLFEFGQRSTEFRMLQLAIVFANSCFSL